MLKKTDAVSGLDTSEVYYYTTEDEEELKQFFTFFCSPSTTERCICFWLGFHISLSSKEGLMIR